MSLSLSIQDDKLIIQYSDERRRAKITVVLSEKRVLTDVQGVDINVTWPTQPMEFKPISAEGVESLRVKVKEEIVELLRAHNAVDEKSALTIDDVVDIAQYDKKSFQAINQLIRMRGSASRAKRDIALILAVLQREGKVAKVAESRDGEKIHKYFLKTMRSR